jgi:hypothetical protein
MLQMLDKHIPALMHIYVYYCRLGSTVTSSGKVRR